MTPAIGGVAAEDASQFCEACRHNRVIPDLSDTTNMERWRVLELGKHHLFYSILRFGLPCPDRNEDPQEGLAFDFLSETTDANGAVQKVLTGHDSGLITINIEEADDAEREKLRSSDGRSLSHVLGHFRHEVGHYYWDRLMRDGRLAELSRVVRRRTGGLRPALAAHYQNGPRADWQAACLGLRDAPPLGGLGRDVRALSPCCRHAGDGARVRDEGQPLWPGQGIVGRGGFDPYRSPDMTRDRAWLPLTFAVNSLNRSMGNQTFTRSCFRRSPYQKLGFVREVVTRARRT